MRGMDFSSFCAIAPSCGEIFNDYRPYWEPMQENFPTERYREEYLRESAVRKHWAMSELREDSLEPLLAMAKRTRENESLLALAAMLHYILFEDASGEGVWRVPYPAALGGDRERGLFNFLVALGFMPRFAELNRLRSIPEEVIKDSLKQVGCYAHNFHKAYSSAGIYSRQLVWLHHYMPPRRYFRIGRLEFCQTQYSLAEKPYRRKQDGKTAILAPPGLFVSPDGKLLPVKTPESSETLFYADAQGVTGNIIEKSGLVQCNASRLPFTEWEPLLSQDDAVLEMHIPSGGNMLPELVRSSFAGAIGFFDTFFPGSGIKAVWSNSWIFSPQLAEMLPEKSNILSLQRIVSIMPSVPGPGSDSGLWFLFLSSPPYDPKSLPRDTSMRRAVASWLEKGNRFAYGKMLLSREEIMRL